MSKIPADATFGWDDEAKIKARLAENAGKLLALQYKLYAENRQSLLIVLQAMDAGGKDGVINHVLYCMNPQGCRSQSFKIPTALEASHDFLWREHNVAPHNGEVVIFNRSHYECVLAERVHGDVEGKRLKQRFDYINDFENILRSNRTRVLKFYLHISKEEQLKRFGERLDDPAKHWKISENDYREREFWEQYRTAFEDALSNCSTADAPWFVIPANHKTFRNLAVSEIIVVAMEEMAPKIPPATIDVAEIRRLYHRDEVEAGKDKRAAAPAPETPREEIRDDHDRKQEEKELKRERKELRKEQKALKKELKKGHDAPAKAPRKQKKTKK